MFKKNIEDPPIWLVYDFGKSDILETWTLNDRKQDVLEVIRDFGETRTKSEEMKTFVKNLKSKVDEITDGENFMDLIIEYLETQTRDFLGRGLKSRRSKRRTKRRTKRPLKNRK